MREVTIFLAHDRFDKKVKDESRTVTLLARVKVILSVIGHPCNNHKRTLLTMSTW